MRQTNDGDLLQFAMQLLVAICLFFKAHLSGHEHQMTLAVVTELRVLTCVGTQGCKNRSSDTASHDKHLSWARKHRIRGIFINYSHEKAMHLPLLHCCISIQISPCYSVIFMQAGKGARLSCQLC